MVIPVLPKNYSIFSEGSKDKLNFLLKFLQGPLDSERKKIFELLSFIDIMEVIRSSKKNIVSLEGEFRFKLQKQGLYDDFVF